MKGTTEEAALETGEEAIAVIEEAAIEEVVEEEGKFRA